MLSRSIAKRSVGTAAVAVALVACAFSLRAAVPSHAAPPTRPAYDLAALFAPDIGYADQNGRRFSARDLDDKIVLLDTVSATCPSLCATRSLDMDAIDALLPAGIRETVRLVSVSVGKDDRPDALRAFGGGLRLDPGRWSLIAADGDGAARFLRALALMPPGTPALKTAEEPPTGLFLFDRRGRLMQRYSGRPVDRKRIAREIAALHAYDERFAAAPARMAAGISSAIP